VPGVAFDRACRRLGNGKGYYDRAIAALRPACTVGVCYAAQLVDEVPVGPHDAVLDAVVTESGIFRSRV
jgi:5-formyltetrahydrofolate cyclo-ligase